MFNVGDRILHRDYDNIIGVVTRVFIDNDNCSEALWYLKTHQDRLGYLAVEKEDNWIMFEPALIEYKYDQSGDTEEDI